MLKLAHRLHLALKPLHDRGILQPLGRQDLQGHDFVQLRVQGFIHSPHAPLSQFLQQSILAQFA